MKMRGTALFRLGLESTEMEEEGIGQELQQLEVAEGLPLFRAAEAAIQVSSLQDAFQHPDLASSLLKEKCP